MRVSQQTLINKATNKLIPELRFPEFVNEREGIEKKLGKTNYIFKENTYIMNKNTLKSIGAILSGFLLMVITSIMTDLTFVKTGLMKQPFELNSSWFIIFVIFYRSLYATIGSFLTTRLAPNRPMLHSMIGGSIGFALSIIGAIAMWETPPHWYSISLIITALPCAWLGGQLFLTKAK